MVAAMVTWMRVRGCSWRDGAGIGAAMLVPVAAVLAPRGLGLSNTLPWLSNSEHPAMLIGMLVFMLYRRERYTSGYSFVCWSAEAGGQRSSGAQLAEAGQPSTSTSAGPGWSP